MMKMGAVMDKTSADYRKKRVKRIKKIIIAICIFLLVFPTILSICLMVKISSLETKLEELQKTSVTAAPDAQKDKGEATKESAKVTEKSKDTSQTKKVYLTFDDGPGIESDKILDVLKDEGVQATFFVNGKDDDYSKKVYKRIVNEGHTLGMHSFSHLYDDIYSSKESFREDTKKEYEFLHKITGQYPKYYRFPGGSSSSKIQIPINELKEVLSEFNLEYVDWNIISADSVNTLAEESEISNGIIQAVKEFDNSIVLMYDVATRPNTVKALPTLIRPLKAQNYELLPIDENTQLVRQDE